MPPQSPDRRVIPTEVLVIGWYPAADALTSGRFVADQVEALQATGAIRPSVVAFENAAVRGAGELRERQATAIQENVERSIAVGSPFVQGGAAGPASVPVARLSVAAGETPSSGPDHRAVHRTASLLTLLDGEPRRNWQIVHAHVGYPEGAAGAAAADRLGVPYVITEHASFLGSLLADPIVRERYRTTLRGAARVIAVSRTLADEMAEIVPEVGDRVEVIPNAVAVDAFAGADEGGRVRGQLLYVGGRPATKGIETLLRAFAVVRGRRPEATLRLIGPGAIGANQSDAAWRELAVGLRVDDLVSFEPAADRGDVVAAMHQADLFVHPSHRETFGVVAVEALAAGLPVVAVDSGGVTEILGDAPDRLGAVARGDDPAALAAAILRALERRDSFDPAALRAHVAERYAAPVVAARLAEVYRAVLAERPAREPPVATPRIGGGLSLDLAAGLAASPTVVVGWSGRDLARTVAFPDLSFGETTIVTAADAAGDPPVIRGAMVRLAPPKTAAAVTDLLGWGRPATTVTERLRRRVQRTLRSVGSIAGHSAGQDRLLDDLAATLAAALDEAGERPVAVCLSGFDHLVAARFIASGRAIAAPGGLRWLADARAAAMRPEPADGAQASEA